MPHLRVLIVDNQRLFCEGLATLLDRVPDLHVVGVARNGQEALEFVAQHRPEIVLMDAVLPVMNGIVATGLIKERYPATQILLLSAYAEDEYIIEGLAQGASGYLLKDLNVEALVDNIHHAADGQMILPAPIAAKLTARLRQVAAGALPPAISHTPAYRTAPLTPREREIATLIGRGYSNREIADRLFMSQGTVRNYISIIYGKIGTSDRSKAMLLLRGQVGIG